MTLPQRFPVIRISLPYVWQLADGIDGVGRIDPTKPMEKLALAVALFNPRQQLEALMLGSVFSPTLRSSRASATLLYELLLRHTDGDYEGVVQPHELWAIRDAYTQFKTAFLAELGTLPAYFVSQKGSHDTLTLLDQPGLMFPDDLAKKVPEAMFDVAEAGKSLCYETGTACGFHLFRVTEAVLRRYYAFVTNGQAHPKVRNIMVYVNAIRQKKCGDERILSVIEHMSKLHRNPLIHPEVALTVDEAISILGMARSAVTAMLSALPALPPTTTTPAKT
jgi:hypothetical protein